MIVLNWRGEDARDHIVALFGLGLIGSSILSPIMRRTTLAQSQYLPFGWQRDDTVTHQAAEVVGYLTGLMQAGARNQHASQLDFVWAAGKGGFQGSMKELSDELQAFDRVLDIAGSMASRFPNASHAFHLMSSAGGLFEGQRFVDANTEPRPRRAYGEVKLQQEVKLASAYLGASVFIYRPSTIYGYKAGGRLGLVAILVKNAINNRTTRVFGDLSTLRDYVFVKDVGRFVASKITGRTTHSDVARHRFLLATGKPTSMQEILGLIGWKLQRRLLLKFDWAPQNAAHTSFRPAALPVDWSTTPLSYGVQRTVNDIVLEFALGR